MILNNGNLGIGTETPTATLDVNGISIFRGDATYDTTNVSLSSAATFNINAPNVVGGRMIVTTSGNVGIGTTSPNSSYKLHVVGKIFATDDIIGFSDKRLKHNLKIISDSLQKIHKLNGYTFDMFDTTKTRTGLIAQEVLEVLPEAVHQDDKGFYALSYGNLAGFFVEAIKELDNKYASHIKDLQQQINNLSAQIAKTYDV